MVLVLGTPEKFLLHKKACSGNSSFGFRSGRFSDNLLLRASLSL